jgi:penicillin amidase
MNRGTENNRIVFNKDGVSYCDVTPPGQSGFIKPDGEPSPHAHDQLRLYAGFACKPLWLSEADVERNTVEREMLTYSLPK